MKKFILNILRNSFGGKGFEQWEKFRNFQAKKEMRQAARKYLKELPTILERIKGQEKIKILFFVNNMGMWKYDGLVKLLQESDKFQILVIPYIYPQFDDSLSLSQRNEIKKYCEENKIPFFDGYDFETHKYVDITWVKPDIVVYTQPYNIGYSEWLIDKFSDSSIFVYTPYGIGVTKGNQFYDTYLANFAWAVFAGTKLEKEIYQTSQSVNKNNVVQVGLTIWDSLRKVSPTKNPWKSTGKKRIIWAPHHSIDDKFTFSSSNFERIAEKMYQLVKNNPDIEIAFKPHPLLKERLYEKWGKAKTDKYYTDWANLPNGFICEGEYIELFAYSDGMIHDCASFVCEYLVTGKPVMYIAKENVIPTSVNNELGIKCFDVHYHGYSIEDIEKFINNVIIDGVDSMKTQRDAFINHELAVPNDVSVAQNMMNEIKKLVKNK